MQYCSFNYFASGKGIGTESMNGFNFLLNDYREFKSGPKVYCSSILKSSRNKNADNLFYEYVVGKYLNRYISNNCPFFVHTHGLFQHHNGTEDIFFNKHKRKQELNKNDVKQLLPLLNNNLKLNNTGRQQLFKLSYHEPQSLCILIESVPKPVTLHDMLRTMDRNFYTFSLVPIYFRYIALFTSTDQNLHIMIYIQTIFL